MTFVQTYYTAESQDIPIVGRIRLNSLNGGVTQENFIFNMRVISDVIVEKKIATGFNSVRTDIASGDMGYTAILTTLGRGGAAVDPVQYLKSFIPYGYEYSDLPDFDADKFLHSTKYISNVSGAPVGSSTELTVTTSLYLYSSIIKFSATEQQI